jgi:uncharacterized protein YndB with AHSA1/START domain
MQEALVVRRETPIPAPPAAVFAFLTDPEKILRWMGTEAQVEPQPGGLYLVNVTGARVARGSFREVVPVHRLAYSFGWDGSEVVPPGSSLVEIDLVEQPDGTLLRLTHTGLPNAEECASHAEGLGPLRRPAGRGCSRARLWPGPLARPHWQGVTVFRHPRKGTTMIVVLGRKIFGALLAIAGAILLTGHCATSGRAPHRAAR